MKLITLTTLMLVLAGSAIANKISDDQMKDWYPKYGERAGTPKPEQMMLNEDKEPALKRGFVDLYNGKNLDGWVQYGGKHKYEAKDGYIEATVVPGEKSAYLSTKRNDYKDFIFTCEIKWIVDGNTGVQFRSMVKDGNTVAGPQVEMEESTRDRGWSGGIYAQSSGGQYWYPLWLDAHKKVRGAIDYNGWNRVTIAARGKVVRTWINGIPAAKWRNGEYTSGLFALQAHSGKQGQIQFRNVKVKELKLKQ
ncbi:MAG: DUF1080 domain-containing protein [Puniceicoccaceae bacterium]